MKSRSPASFNDCTRDSSQTRIQQFSPEGSPRFRQLRALPWLRSLSQGVPQKRAKARSLRPLQNLISTPCNQLHLGFMKLLLLGAGKTGSLVADVAREHGHEITTLRSGENPNASALAAERLKPIDVVVDFTTPGCVLGHIRACLAAGKNMVVGTTGWYSEIPKIRAEVEKHNTGFVFGSNFSVDVNLFFDLVRAAAPAIQHRYLPHIYERHHVHKKDAPSGTAATIQGLLQHSPDIEVEITSFREGEVVGMHE